MSEPLLDAHESVPMIAVVGMAGRFPGARTAAELWRNLCGGVESVSSFTVEELAAAGIDPRLLADPRYVRAKGVLADADLFDAAFFGFTPREAEQMDPQHRVFLECAWEALEDAGCDPQRFPGRAGVYAGCAANTYLIFNLLPHRELMEKTGVLQLLLLNDRDFLATRVSYKLDLKGPSVAVQTACSTSLVAIHMACQALLTGECDLALAGGVSISTPLVSGYLYQEGSVLSPDGRCRAFDAAAAGAVEGNGCGVVALKRLADALADGDTIRAVVRGSAVTNDGASRVGFTAPSVDGQAAAISEALLISGVDPDTIGYVETHGSGTPLGDPIEIEALTQAFRRAGARGTGACAIGSAKTNLGHCNAAAGVAGFLKAVLALEHGTLPPSLHFERPNPRIDFAASPFRVCTECTPWEAGDAPRRAGVSAFGLGGTNAHVVLEEAPATKQDNPGDPPSRPAQLLVLSARTPEALDAATVRLAGHLEADGSSPPWPPSPIALPPAGRGGNEGLADIAWTLQTGRRGLEHRRAVVARDRETAVAALRGSVGTAPVRCEEPGRRSVVFLFPGLGDQSVDMARGLYETEPVFREQVDLCAGRLAPEIGCDLREVLFSPDAWSPPARPSHLARSGPDLRALLRRDGSAESPAAARLRQTLFAQPACFVVEYALARLLMHWGVEPRAMIGYSLGEYVAACLAGVLSLDDALSLVARRAKLIQDLPPGAMLAVPLAEEEVRRLLEGLDGPDGRLSVCATNGPHFCVVGGQEEAVGELERELAGRGASCLRLRTTHAFHSSMMEPAAAALTAMARAVETRPPRIPYLSNVTGAWITEGDVADPAYWARHMLGTVRFAEGLGELLRESGRIYVEVGPGATLGALVRQHPDATADLSTVAALGAAGSGTPGSDLDDLLAAVGRLWAAGVEVDWERFHGGERRRRVPLPTYPFERRRFWIDPPAPADAPMPSGAADRAEAGATAGDFLIQAPAQTPAQTPARRPGLSTPYVAPRDEIEESLAAIWQELFGIAPIGVEDSFLELGGQSLLAIQVIAQVAAAFDVHLTVAALFEAPTVAGLAAEVARARGEETAEDLEDLLAQVEGLSPEEVDRRLASLPAAPPQPPPVARRSGPAGIGDWPLSFDQERLLRLHLEDPEMVSWNVDAGSRVLGPLDVPALLASFAAVVRRHAAWRATFPVVDDRRVQRVSARLAPAASVIDLTALPKELREPSAHQALRERTRAVFDLERGPLVRITLARLAKGEHLCQLTVHHLATDWITFQHCWREVLAFYEAHRAGRSADLPPLPAQYPDYVLWEREWLQGEVLEEHAGFWRRELAGFPLALELPADRPRPPVHRQRGGLYRVRAGAPRTDRLRELGRREGATMFMTVLAVVNALLHRVSGLEKIVLGSNSANRARPELEPVFGFFLTQVPFAADLAGDPPFRELLGRVRRSALSSYAHQNLPFSKLVEALRPEPDPSRSPVVQALVLVLEGQSRLRAGDLDFHAVPLFDGNSRWDLMFGLYDYRDLGLSGPLEYNADLFDASTIGRLLELFYRLIDAVTEDPGLRLSQLPALSEAAERQALVEWKGADRPRVEDLLARLAALRADGDPEAAIACGEETVLYIDLASRAERIVDLLRRLGVWPGTRVALLLAPSPELAAAALAVWKAGGVCVPLDPAEPAVRLAAALADAELGLLVHRGPLPSDLVVTGAARLDVQDLLALPRLAGAPP